MMKRFFPYAISKKWLLFVTSCFCLMLSLEAKSATCWNMTDEPNKTPLALELTIESTGISCYGQNDGQAIAVPTGGTAPYDFTWSNGSLEDTISGLEPGIYSVTVVDNLGEIATAFVTIAEPDPLLASVVLSDTAFTCDINTITATINAIGGTTPYAYAWELITGMIDSSQVTTLTQPGLYPFSVIDANGCVFSSQLLISGHNIPDLVLTITDSIVCNGNLNGEVVATISGGVEPYTFEWSNGQQSDTLSGVGSGAYTVTVTAGDGCVVQSTVFLSQPESIILTLTGTDITCFGQETGAIFSEVNGGSQPYYYTWSNGSNEANLTNLPAGNYSLTLTDHFGCFTIASVTINSGNEILLFTASMPVTCYGYTNGSATVFASGGAGAFTYAWSNGKTTQQITGLSAGTYTAYVTDLNNCVASVDVIVFSPSELTDTIIATADHLNMSNGTATVLVEGGTPPYAYIWSNGDTGATADSLAAGIYYVTITDLNACQLIDSIQILADNCALQLSLTTINPTCHSGNDGAIFIQEITPGDEPYSYIWSTGSTDPFINELTAGAYSVTVTDQLNCMVALIGTLTNPTAMEANFNVTHPSDMNPFGSVSIAVSGGQPPYKAKYNDEEFTSFNNFIIGNLSPGPQTIIITDLARCTLLIEFVVNQLECQLNVSLVSFKRPTCFDSSDGEICITYANNIGTPTIEWTNGGSTNCITNLEGGTYVALVRDTIGCTATLEHVLTAPDPITLANIDFYEGTGALDGYVKVNVFGGSPPFVYQWTKDGASFATTRDINGLNTGTYQLTVIDSKGCLQVFDPFIIKTSATNQLSSNIIHVAPNPVSGAFTIHTQGLPMSGMKTVLFNSSGTGMEIKGDLVGDNLWAFNISHLQAGMYVLRLSAANTLYHTKIIKVN